MAKRKRKKSSTTKIVRIPSARAASPIIRVQTPRAPAVRKKRRHSGRRRSMIGGGGYSEPIGLAAGGLAYGIAVKQGWIQKLPEVPIIGRTGLAAIILHEAKKRGMGGEIVRRAATAAAVLTGYQLGLEGHVTGEAEDYPQQYDGYEGGGYYTGDDSDDTDDGDPDFDDESDLDEADGS